MESLPSRCSDILRLSLILGRARFKLRNAGSYLGILWYLLEPASFFVIILFIQPSLGLSNIPHYPGYVLLGLIMINFFIGTTTASVKSMRENKNLVQSISMPLEAIPLSVIIQFFLSHAFEFAFFVCVYVALYGFTWALVLYPFIFALYAIFVIGASLAAATLGAFIEDLENIWAVCSRLLWLATPIFYTVPVNGLPSKLIWFNPLYHFIAFTRDALLYRTFPGISALIGLFLMSLASLAIGFFLFERYKTRFCDNL